LGGSGRLGSFDPDKSINNQNNQTLFGSFSEQNLTQSVSGAIAPEKTIRPENIHIYKECFRTENLMDHSEVALEER
jgi:hypothetical protein